ncbi:hypothetical protein PSECIP111854_01047 [Pseudoalteromonas sp. CIP111854]|uniref:Uncharacterized protein n=1 Tax=Pseudoalteromonas holothuriae TaxID=2963714 RepID=A0A9W4QTU0_9GAMM|nr:hypothetical protein PSECIP111854_01047 [Pseudoalteromonas sp. CIP111854]
MSSPPVTSGEGFNKHGKCSKRAHKVTVNKISQKIRALVGHSCKTANPPF